MGLAWHTNNICEAHLFVESVILEALLEVDEAEEVPESSHHAFPNMVSRELLGFEHTSLNALPCEARCSI